MAIIVVFIPGIIIFGPVPLMMASNAYSGHIMSSTPDSVFEEDFAKIPEVQSFIEKYPNYITNHSADFLGWKIINYMANTGENTIHLSVKKSVLHQGVKVSAGCSLAGVSSYALNILEDKVTDYLKNDSCLEKSNDKLQSILHYCKQKELLVDDTITTEDGKIMRLPSVLFQFFNGTHYIDNNSCKWQKIK